MNEPDSIGTASMSEDGTITLHLRADDGHGNIGDAVLTVRPDEKHYQAYLEHLGGLEPGQTKPVKPWD